MAFDLTNQNNSEQKARADFVTDESDALKNADLSDPEKFYEAVIARQAAYREKMREQLTNDLHAFDDAQLWN